MKVKFKYDSSTKTGLIRFFRMGFKSPKLRSFVFCETIFKCNEWCCLCMYIYVYMQTHRIFIVFAAGITSTFSSLWQVFSLPVTLFNCSSSSFFILQFIFILMFILHLQSSSAFFIFLLLCIFIFIFIFILIVFAYLISYRNTSVTPDSYCERGEGT